MNKKKPHKKYTSKQSTAFSKALKKASPQELSSLISGDTSVEELWGLIKSRVEEDNKKYVYKNYLPSDHEFAETIKECISSLSDNPNPTHADIEIFIFGKEVKVRKYTRRKSQNNSINKSVSVNTEPEKLDDENDNHSLVAPSADYSTEPPSKEQNGNQSESLKDNMKQPEPQKIQEPIEEKVIEEDVSDNLNQASANQDRNPTGTGQIREMFTTSTLKYASIILLAGGFGAVGYFLGNPNSNTIWLEQKNRWEVQDNLSQNRLPFENPQKQNDINQNEKEVGLLENFLGKELDKILTFDKNTNNPNLAGINPMVFNLQYRKTPHNPRIATKIEKQEWNSFFENTVIDRLKSPKLVAQIENESNQSSNTTSNSTTYQSIDETNHLSFNPFTTVETPFLEDEKEPSSSELMSGNLPPPPTFDQFVKKPPETELNITLEAQNEDNPNTISDNTHTDRFNDLHAEIVKLKDRINVLEQNKSNEDQLNIKDSPKSDNQDESSLNSPKHRDEKESKKLELSMNLNDPIIYSLISLNKDEIQSIFRNAKVGDSIEGYGTVREITLYEHGTKMLSFDNRAVFLK